MHRSNPYYARILEVLLHIQRNLDGALPLEQLARKAHYSIFHFHRIFTGMVGETVMAHVRRLRLERAAFELRHSDKPVVRVALDAGYETQESFTRAFRALFQTTPGRFRRTHQPLPRARSGVHYHPGAEIGGFVPLTGGVEEMKVRVEDREPMWAVFLRHVGPYDQVGETWEELATWAGANGLLDSDTLIFGLGYDDPAVTPADRLRYDACVSTMGAIQVEPPFGVHKLPGGEFAIALHEGAYDRLAETYAKLYGRWLPTSGREPRHGPCVEVYLNDPGVTDPDDLLTEIWIPLKPRKS